MLIVPAIDLQKGVCVRLAQGRFEDATIYGDPFEQLNAFTRAGADWVHIVDLDGAQARRPQQHALIGQLARAGDLRIQCGGGVREAEHVAALLDVGAARVVIGSAAISRPADVAGWIARFGAERICLALDVRADASGAFEVMVAGWTAGSGRTLAEALGLYPRGTIRHVLATDVSRDGVMAGPNFALVEAFRLTRPDIAVQASGGIATLSDLAALRAAGASAAIVGRALYERRINLEDALAG